MPYRGRLQLYLAAGLVLLTLGLLGIQGRAAAESAERRIGIGLDQYERGFSVSHVIPDLPAAAAGFQAGDRLLEVEGHPVTRLAVYSEIAQRFQRGRLVEFVVERDGERVRLEVLPGAPFPWLLFLLRTLAAVLYLALAVVALFERAGDLRARLIFLFAAAVAIELALPTGILGNVTALVVASTLFYGLTGLQIGVELHLASVIPERHGWLRRRGWVIPVYYGVGLGAAGCVVASILSDFVGWQVLPWTVVQAVQSFNAYGYPIWATAVVLLLGSRLFVPLEPLGRHQAGFVLLGVLPWVGFVWTATLFDLLGRSLPTWAPTLQTVLLLAFPLAVFVAIFRYQLLDLELVVRRTLVYTALTASLILVFWAILASGAALFAERFTGRAQIWWVSAATLVLGLLFAPLRRALQRALDRRFFPERYAVRQRLVDLAGELPALGTLPRMGRRLVDRISEIFRVRSATVLVADPESELLVAVASTRPQFEDGFDNSFQLAPDDAAVDRLRRSERPVRAEEVRGESAAFDQRLAALEAQLLVPLMSQEKLVGLLILGPKEGGRRLPAEEIELLDLLGHHVATVFENARLFVSATYESLTGLLRREVILDELERELRRSRRHRRPLTVGLADLDHFKGINDRFGHLTGDDMLKQVAQAVAGALRSTDLVSRFGGEEFLMVLPETDLNGAVTVAEKVREAIEELKVPAENGEIMQVTASIGLAALDHDTPPGAPVELIRAADQALYRAKRAGRNRVEPLLKVN